VHIYLIILRKFQDHLLLNWTNLYQYGKQTIIVKDENHEEVFEDLFSTYTTGDYRITNIQKNTSLLIEEFAWYFYPSRLAKLTTELKKPGLIQELRSILFKTGIFYLLAEPFIGFNKYLLAGCGVFILPQLLSLVSHKLS